MDLLYTKTIIFDGSQPQLAMQPGQRLLRKVQPIQDLKGNPDEPGLLYVTNLRIIWMHRRDKGLNFIIGFGAVNLIESTTEVFQENRHCTLTIKAKRGASRFVFLLKAQNRENEEVFLFIKQVYRDFNSTKLYRSSVLNQAIGDEQLVLLQDEYLVSKYVCSVSIASSKPGCLHLTNIRLAFISRDREVTISSSWATVDKLRKTPGQLYCLNDKIDHSFTMPDQGDCFEQASKLRQAFLAKPILGVISGGKELSLTDFNPSQLLEQDVSVSDKLSKLTLYRTEHFDTRSIVFNWELGLAMEELPSGMGLNELWEVIK